MSKRNQINKKNEHTLQALINLMNDLDQKYSIKVGIIGSQAYEKHPDSGLTNAHLGAIHEFGATINVTDKMRAYLHHIGIHLKPETTTSVIPTRSFLRMPVLSGEFKQYLMDKIGLRTKKDFERIKLKDVPLHTEKYRRKYQKILEEREAREYNFERAKLKMDEIPDLMEKVANFIASEALVRVQDAFATSGFGKWAPISSITKANRKYDKSSPPLQDSGELKNSITAEVKRVE